MKTYTACNCVGNCWLYGGCVAQRPKPVDYYKIPISEFEGIPLGWKCPVCEKVNAPSVLECLHGGKAVESEASEGE